MHRGRQEEGEAGERRGEKGKDREQEEMKR